MLKEEYNLECAFQVGLCAYILFVVFLFCFYLNHAVHIIRSYPVKNYNCSVYSLKYILFQNIYFIYNM